MATALIALGGNRGHVRQTMDDALHLLVRNDQTRLLQRSRCFHTRAVGTSAGDDFMNAAAAVETSLQPLQLLEELQSIEAQLGRVRMQHWGPRNIDLDLIAVDQQTLATPTLTLPHPAAWYRRFVLDPLLDVAPDWVHPLLRQSIRQLHDRLLKRPFAVTIQSDNQQLAVELARVFGSQLQVNLLQPTGPSDGLTSIFIGSQEISEFRLELPLDPIELGVEMVRAALDEPVPID